MSAIYLTAEEVAEATGLKYPARQVDWLRENGWTFHVDARGRPKILREYALARGGHVESRRHPPQLRLVKRPG